MAAKWYTPVEDIPKIVEDVTAAFRSGKTRSIEFRENQLMQLNKMINERKTDILDALRKDSRKNPLEANMTEVMPTVNDIADAVANLREWVKPTEHAPDLLAYAVDKSVTIPEPLGVSLIISAWNYPVHLLLTPLIGAISAGCCAVLKPSELTPTVAVLMAELVPKYLDPACYKVVNGAVSETTKLLELKFDHIFYTGSGNVGRIVMAAAAKHLARVTLELGGKSPAFVDSDCDFSTTARRIVWGKFTNMGQTCIAPDYVLCTPATASKLLPEIQKALVSFYGNDPKLSPDLCRIINRAHFNRIRKLLEDENQGTKHSNGPVDDDDLWIPPTIIDNASPNSSLMKEEIFGPVLPIIYVDNAEEAVQFVGDRDKPLAAYCFSRNKKLNDFFMKNTTAGMMCVNDCLIQAVISTVPFGGVGASGTGSYHGYNSFREFSHMKGVFVRKQALEFVNVLRYPPFSDTKITGLSLAIGRTPRRGFGVPWLKMGLLLVAGFFAVRLFRWNPDVMDDVLDFLGL